VLHQLRQTRYLMLGSLMLIVAAICIAAGSWQVERLVQKHDANDRLRANDKLATAPVGDVLTTTSTAGSLHQGEQTQFRHVSATGTYSEGGELLVRERTQDGVVGFLVLTPLVTDQPGHEVLLVNRGFLAADGDHTPTVAPPPLGTQTITGRVQPTENRDDHWGSVEGQVRTINIADLARRTGDPLYGGYVELLRGQPGTSGLTVISDPDLSNPAGGAIEPQHLAYVIQWFLFALLALAAPLVMARVDSRRGDEPVRRSSVREALHDEPPAPEIDLDERVRAAKLADRYGSARRT
jgi:cytochrome oxidase assembly protein ShyY1